MNVAKKGDPEILRLRSGQAQAGVTASIVMPLGETVCIVMPDYVPASPYTVIKKGDPVPQQVRDDKVAGVTASIVMPLGETVCIVMPDSVPASPYTE